ncbi:hypothetical protein KSU1_D0269 [Candidatus Jettenia caeni]|uniref:Uncharacterized protein n=1 Tax=Candidatus Jettenia caeni TaxID=247490 RepID=I3IPD3_9BACT|nr:hypothetical protein KSU1_D0269 [Candidatus Jettenia caeni]
MGSNLHQDNISTVVSDKEWESFMNVLFSLVGLAVPTKKSAMQDGSSGAYPSN